MAFNSMGLVISMIPESMAFVVWILFAAGIVGIVYGVKQMKNNKSANAHKLVIGIEVKII